jgi:signal transduction histidine kinase
VAGEGGLSQFDGRGFVTLTKENGLPGSSVSGILEDDGGAVWIAGELGIIRVKPQELQNAFKSSSYRMQRLLLDTTDGLPGLPSQEEPFPSAAKSADGRLWFAATDGIAIIDPRRLPMNTVPPPVVIQRVTADNRIAAIAPQLHFPPKLRNLEIAFAALSFSVPERVLFRYKLEGYDSDWHKAVAARFATYTNLPPRQYRFRVIGCNNDGVWNENGATLQFDIAPMFYQTNWFRLLCIALAAFSLWILYRWRLRFVTARLDLRHAERLSERERIARELHDTLLQSIQGLMLRFQAVAKGMSNDEPARLMLEKALDRADEVMAEGRGRVTGLRTVYQESKDLSLAFSSVAREFVDTSHIAFRVVVEGTVRRLHPLVRDEAYRIGREAITNAFLHARSRGIEVEICYSPKELCIRIQDDGCGIDVDVLASGGKSSHWGLRGMTERANKIRSRLNISSGVGAGTEIELRIPSTVAYDNTRSPASPRAQASPIGAYRP